MLVPAHGEIGSGTDTRIPPTQIMVYFFPMAWIKCSTILGVFIWPGISHWYSLTPHGKWSVAGTAEMEQEKINAS